MISLVLLQVNLNAQQDMKVPMGVEYNCKALKNTALDVSELIASSSGRFIPGETLSGGQCTKGYAIFNCNISLKESSIM
jgi:hypothetical protein